MKKVEEPSFRAAMEPFASALRDFQENFAAATRPLSEQINLLGRRLAQDHAEKVAAGLEDSDPTVRARWERVRRKGLTPLDVAILGLKDPRPSDIGRPRGSGSYAAADEPFVLEWLKLEESGLTPGEIKRQLVPKMRGVGSPESIAKRLERQVRKEKRRSL
jgi:hypothetical protein